MEVRRNSVAVRNVEVRTEPKRRQPSDFQYVRMQIADARSTLVPEAA